ncbi:MAG TPA: hypothetical protein VK427_04280, partial [Kofleriaceae bacterium]|nr:hypothetical protein [Kofleriaceae bacterium]
MKRLVTMAPHHVLAALASVAGLLAAACDARDPAAPRAAAQTGAARDTPTTQPHAAHRVTFDIARAPTLPGTLYVRSPDGLVRLANGRATAVAS